MPWIVEVFPHAVRDYRKLSAPARERVRDSLQRLGEADSPLLHPGVMSLAGKLAGYHRLRVGPRRVIFELIRERSLIAVHRIVPRKDAY